MPKRVKLSVSTPVRFLNANLDQRISTRSEWLKKVRKDKSDDDKKNTIKLGLEAKALHWALVPTLTPTACEAPMLFLDL